MKLYPKGLGVFGDTVIGPDGPVAEVYYGNRPDMSKFREYWQMNDDVLEKAEALLKALTYDDSGENGRGGNGGLISRETIHKADELRIAIFKAKQRPPPPLPSEPFNKG